MNNLKKFFKRYDLFGHPINLQFGTQGHEYKTFIGGFISFFIKCFMFLIIFTMGRNMVTYNHNKTESKHAMLTNNEMLEITKYSDMKMELYLVIQGNDSYTPVNHKQLNKYINIKTGQINMTSDNQTSEYRELIDC